MAKADTRATRSDSLRNWAKILEAARTALESDPGATMQAIARAAGVGQGTLYRHFPTRDALVVEVHRRDVAALVDAAPTLLNALPPQEALRAWLDQLATYGRIKRGILDVMYAATHEQLDNEGRGPVVAALETLLRAGQDAGVVRPQVSAEDVLLLVSFLWHLGENTDDTERRAARLLDVVEDGLTTHR